MDTSTLRNPIWRRADNLRDPAVMRLEDGYVMFYSRFSNRDWGREEDWAVAAVYTKDFATFELDRDVTPKGYASPGDPVLWHGRWLLPYQSYPKHPARLFYSELRGKPGDQRWSAPQPFLPEANQLPWNTQRRAIDATFLVDGDVLHCFFVGSDDRRQPRANLIGQAVTQDPGLEDWDILTADEPLIGRSERAPDGCENVTVYRTGEVWTLLYSEGMERQHLAYAQSTDLRNWAFKGPLDLEVQTWMAGRYGAPAVWCDEDGYYMILMGLDTDGRATLGLFTSPDGLAWTPLPERTE